MCICSDSQSSLWAHNHVRVCIFIGTSHRFEEAGRFKVKCVGLNVHMYMCIYADARSSLCAYIYVFVCIFIGSTSWRFEEAGRFKVKIACMCVHVHVHIWRCKVIFVCIHLCICLYIHRHLPEIRGGGAIQGQDCVHMCTHLNVHI